MEEGRNSRGLFCGSAFTAEARGQGRGKIQGNVNRHGDMPKGHGKSDRNILRLFDYAVAPLVITKKFLRKLLQVSRIAPVAMAMIAWKMQLEPQHFWADVVLTPL